MKIAFFVHSFPEISETFILRQVTGLLDRGHELRIFAYNAAPNGPVHDAVNAYQLRRLVRILPRHTDGGVSARARIAALAVLRPADARALGGWRSLVRTVAAFSAEGPFDVVHCHYGDLGLHYRVAARVLRSPLVVSFYGYDCSSYPRAHGQRVFEPLFAAADAVTSLSTHMDARLRELGSPADLLRRIPLAADPATFRPVERPSRDAGPVRILTIARLTEKKGIEFALRAIALVVEEFPGLRYDIVGDGPLHDELEHIAESLGVRANVTFYGSRTDDSVRAALSGADLFMLPSITAADGDQEGTPTAVIEAAFSALPVLSTWHAGIPELVRDGETGYLVPERDYEALANRLRTLLRSPEQRWSMGAAGRRHVEREHTTGAVAERLEQLYLELVERTTSQA
jgi:colanic acid/amylovoran biosynthesis glycosyltransferase